MAVYLSPVFGAGAQLFDSQGRVLAGGFISTFLAGSSTPLATWTDNTGLVNNALIIPLDSAGRPPQEIWLTGGQAYKFIVTSALGVPQGIAFDNITGVNDPTAGLPVSPEWVALGVAPTFIGATQFSVPGNQTAKLPIGQRIKLTVTSGTAYGTIVSSVFAALTTVTAVMDSTPIDSGLSAVQYGLLNAQFPSVDIMGLTYKPTATPPAGTAGAVVQRADRALTVATLGGGTTAYTLTPTAPLLAYPNSAPFTFVANVSSVGAPTINISGLGALLIKTYYGAGVKVAASLYAGQVYTGVFDGTDFVLLGVAVSSGKTLRITVITASGTWTKQADVGSISVELVGGGGGAPSAASPFIGGGGSGGYCRKFIAAPAASYAATIGAGGTSAGGNGGNTTFDTMTGGGGLGAGGAGGNGGGAGGSASGGDVNIPGSPGVNGSARDGVNTTPGPGGASFFGAGAASGGENAATGTNAVANTGSGGSGGIAAGGAGGSGLIVVTEYS